MTTSEQIAFIEAVLHQSRKRERRQMSYKCLTNRGHHIGSGQNTRCVFEGCACVCHEGL